MAYNGFYGSPVAFPVRPPYPHPYFPDGAPMIYTGPYPNPYRQQTSNYPPYNIPPVYRGPFPQPYQQLPPAGLPPQQNSFYFGTTQKAIFQSFGQDDEHSESREEDDKKVLFTKRKVRMIA